MISHTPLDVFRLSAAAQRALGPGPGRMMAARGIMPLSSTDQVAVLYQLALDAEPGVAQAARATAVSLPEKLLSATLADPAVDPRVLDFFAGLAADKAPVFDAIVLNPSAADPTIAQLAGKADARGVDLISHNEQRVLRHPEIIAAMYMNRRARMSTIDRVVELAVRNDVRVPGLAAWDEVARALTGGSTSGDKDDALFLGVLEAAGDDSALTAGDAEQPLSEAEPGEDRADPSFEEMPVHVKVRLASIGNATIRAKAVRSHLRIVAMAAIKAQGVKDMEVVHYACNRNLSEDVIRYIASKREWTKLYGVKVALCRNPKTPLVEATRMLAALRDRDLQNLAKSKGIPTALVAQARRMLMQRRGGTGKP